MRPPRDKDEKSVNGTHIFHWEVSTGKMGLLFQEFRLFRKFSSGTNQKVMFHLHPNKNFPKYRVFLFYYGWVDRPQNYKGLYGIVQLLRGSHLNNFPLKTRELGWVASFINISVEMFRFSI